MIPGSRSAKNKEISGACYEMILGADERLVCHRALLCTFSVREEPDGEDPDGEDLLEREVSADKSRYHPFHRVYQVAYDPQGMDLRFHAKAPSKAFVS